MLNHRIIYKNHNGTIGSWEGFTDGNGHVTTISKKNLSSAGTKNQFDAKGKNVGRSNETSDEEQALLELNSKTKKKLDGGYVETIAEAQMPVTNSLGTKLPMLATPLDKVKPESIDWDTAFVQPKLDGHRCLYKGGMLYSRGGKEIIMPHILGAIQAQGFGDMHLDGELYIHGMPLNEISKLAKKLRPESVNLQYHIYDQVLGTHFQARMFDLTVQWVDHTEENCLQLVETNTVDSITVTQHHHERYRALGYEGTMIRFGKDPYQDGKRSRKLLKMKEFHDAEFQVIDVEEGKPYIREDMTYQVPVWVCAVPDSDETFTVTHPGTMEDKHDAWVNRKEHLQQWLTVKYHYLSKDGIPQLPIALQFQQKL